MPRTPAHREERSGARARGLLEAKNLSHKPAIAVAISAACARDKEMTASRRSIGCDEPMEQHRGRAAAAMAKAAGQGGRSRHRCCALRAHSNTAARTPPASQNLPRARPRTNRARIRTHAARDGGGEQICRAWRQSLLAAQSAHINARRPRPRRSAAPRPSPGRARPRR